MYRYGRLLGQLKPSLSWPVMMPLNIVVVSFWSKRDHSKLVSLGSRSVSKATRWLAAGFR